MLTGIHGQPTSHASTNAVPPQLSKWAMRSLGNTNAEMQSCPTTPDPMTLPRAKLQNACRQWAKHAKPTRAGPVVVTPASSKRRANNKQEVAKTSAAVLRRRRTTCLAIRHAQQRIRAKTGPSMACTAGCRRRPCEAQKRTNRHQVVAADPCPTTVHKGLTQ